MNMVSKRGKNVIIIGAGIAGLSAGCYGRMNGYDTKIFEMHSIPGGCCTAWKRKDYTFDACIEWMVGTAPGTEMNQIWQEVGALKGKQVKQFEVFNQITGTDGRIVKFYVDPDKLERHLSEISPADNKPVKEFCDLLRAFVKGNDFPFLKHPNFYNLIDGLKIFWKTKHLGSKMEYIMRTRIQEFTDKFEDKLLRDGFNHFFFFNNKTFCLMPFLHTLSHMKKGHAGFPEGGSLQVALSMEKRYKELGGEIAYDSKVEEILVKENRAVGVRLKNGEVHYANVIVSAGDGRSLIYKLLKGKYTNPVIDELYKDLINKPYGIFPGPAISFIGINDPLTEVPSSTTYMLDNETCAALPGSLEKCLTVMNRTKYEKKFAPRGKSVLLAFYLADYNYWQNLSTDRKKYNDEKKKMHTVMVDFLAKKYPGIREKIEYIDTSTPLTWERYTGNYHGSIMAWNIFGKEDEMVTGLANDHRMQLPGLSNLYMTGHWISMGGTIRAVTSGRHVMQFICDDDKKKFKAWVG